MRNKVFSVDQLVVLYLLFFGSMNFMSKYFYFVFIASFFYLGVQKKMKIDSMFIILFLFSWCYIFFCNEYRSSVIMFMKSFAYPLCYLLGLNFMKNVDFFDVDDKQRVEKLIKIAISVPAIGAFVHFLFNLSINYGSISRNTIDIWTGNVLSATGQSALAIMAIGVFVAQIFSSNTRLVKAVSILGIVLIFFYNLVLAGRTIIAIILVMLALAAIFYVRCQEKRYTRKLFYIIRFSFMGVLLLLFFDWMVGQETILNSNLFRRFENSNLFDDTRLSLKLQYISYMMIYPFGGGEIHEVVGTYAHELYLDIYNDVGILGYVLIIAFIIISIKKLIYLIKCPALSFDVQLLLACIYTAMLLEFFIEPIIAGMPWFFASFCFIQGLVSYLYYVVRKNESIRD